MSRHIYSMDHKNVPNSGGNLYFSRSVLHKEGLLDVPQFIWKLVCIIWPIMERDTAGSQWQGSAWNGVITASQRLSIGLCFFAGGSVYDIAGNHGVCV